MSLILILRSDPTSIWNQDPNSGPSLSMTSQSWDLRSNFDPYPKAQPWLSLCLRANANTKHNSEFGPQYRDSTLGLNPNTYTWLGQFLSRGQGFSLVSILDWGWGCVTVHGQVLGRFGGGGGDGVKLGIKSQVRKRIKPDDHKSNPLSQAKVD